MFFQIQPPRPIMPPAYYGYGQKMGRQFREKQLGIDPKTIAHLRSEGKIEAAEAAEKLSAHMRGEHLKEDALEACLHILLHALK